MIGCLLAVAALLQGSPPQSALEAEVQRFAEAWTSKDSGFLSGSMMDEGIRLHLPEEEHLLIKPRQAGAALSAFLKLYSGGNAEVSSVSYAKGDQRKGYAEIRWMTVSPGVPEPVIFTVFVAFSLEENAWGVTEIRVLFR